MVTTNGNQPVTVMALYRPHPGKEAALLEVLRSHVPRLQKWGLAGEAAPVLLSAGDGTIIEIFDWRSREAIDRAHRHDGVRALWSQFEQVCTYSTLHSLPQADALFPEFTRLTSG